MKNFIFAMLLVIGGLNAASARSLNPETFVKEANLITWDFDVDSHLRSFDVTGGKVSVNPVTKIANVTLNLANNCPVGAYCFAYIPEFKIELPITKIEKDGCGVVTYRAERNEMPVDGAKNTLVIKDTTLSVCEMFYPAATTITYDETFINRLQGQTETRHSRMTAEKLHSPFIR